MHTKDQLKNLHQTLQQIFTLPVSKTTFREVQNAIFSFVQQSEEQANQFFESLMKNSPKSGLIAPDAQEIFNSLSERFAIPIFVARNVYEKGEFLNILSSDLVRHPQGAVLLNRVRRVDGEEYQFATDSDATLNIIDHFTARIEDLFKADKKDKELSTENKQTVKKIMIRLKKLVTE